MKTVATAVTLAVPEGPDGAAVILHPSPVEADGAKSVHVLGFTSDEKLLLAESKGAFSPEEWDRVLEIGQRVCCRRQGAGLDETMGEGGIESASLADFMRATMEAKTAADLHWK
jgi:exosome complex component RRP46